MLKKLVKDLQALDYDVEVNQETRMVKVSMVDDYGTVIEESFRFNELNAHLGKATTSVLNYVVKRMDARCDILSHSNYAY